VRPTVTPEQMAEIGRSVWSAAAGLSLVRRAGPLPARPDERTLVASVSIHGAWEGLVSARCALDLGRRAAALMFGAPLGLAAHDQVRDAQGELANMVGGQVAGLLPEPCTLSIPTVVDGVGYAVGVPARSRLHAQAVLEAGGLLVLTLFEREAPT
jgi:chemotaxis protein CheX